jgi:hypothetical protein
MNEYSFDSFLERMSRENYLDIIKKAASEGEQLERSSSNTKGCVARRERGSLELSRKIGGFLFYMRNGIRPSGVSDDEFAKYRTVVQALVDKNQMNPEALRIFDATDIKDSEEP